jgi:Protein of unknown function (DUF1553)/Protein of unknown function (DUF1549)/Planctomycete cytochrome C/PA14 domain
MIEFPPPQFLPNSGTMVMIRVLPVVYLLILSTRLIAADTNSTIDFSRQVQPILAAKCLKCHGSSKASGGVAFDKREHALAKTESGEPALVPNKADASGLIARISSTDETLRMPPEGKPLTAAEINILKQWINEGAEWAQPWAFRKVVSPAVPTVRKQGWTKNEIDHFILHGLERAELTPNGVADKRTMVRRAYFNLLGLPPTPAQVEAFVNDSSPNAWEKLIDQLLASEHYGEQWGRKWLDVVRYAETNSFERDNPKPHVWRYRDYVIRAFNENKPYNQFLQEQLAGDEMPNPTADQLIATGFYRLGVWDDEPADRDLAMYDGFDDLVTTVGQGMLGLTMNCARCHDHKIDPLTQKDYYQLVSFFRNIAPMQTGGPNIEQALHTTAEAKATYENALRDRREQLQVAEKEVARLEEIFRIMTAKQQTASTSNAKTNTNNNLENVSYKLFKQSFDLLPDFDSLKPTRSGEVKSNLFDIALAETNKEFGFVFTGSLKVPADGEYTFYLDSDDGSRLSLNGKVELTYDGIHGTGNEKTVRVALKKGAVPIRIDYFQRHHGLGLIVSWEAPGMKRTFFTPVEKEDEKRIKKENIAKQIQNRGLEILGTDEFAKYQSALKDVQTLRAEPPAEKALVVKENGSGSSPDVFVLMRGTPGNHGEQVTPGFPKIFESPAPEISTLPAANSTGRRTALARWITSQENQLTARVFVNRVWQGHFGRGIVRSANNFGAIGTPPTHPELLDWLAADFMAHGWNVKRLHKMMMLSQTYQMSSAGNSVALQKDPANDLFWRVDMRRLSAEEVRDAMLAVSGKLNLAKYGPSVYPQIQAEVLAGQSVPGRGWGKSTPAEQARRSVYIHVKRSLITPLLASFDFPETDVSCEARFVTTQPGQSFAMLNGAFANEQAHEFATRLKAETNSKNENELFTKAYQLALDRSPSEAELARARDLFQQLQTKHQLSPEQALDQFCLFMLNLNEFMYLD